MVRSGTVGSALQQAREDRGLPLDEVAKAINVGLHLLEALECNQFEQLPGGPFNKGFVRAYARHVGLDPEATVLAYAREERVHGLSTPDASKEKRWDFSHLLMFHDEDGRKTLVLDWLALRGTLVGALVVAFLALGGWVLFRVGWAEQSVLSAVRPGTSVVERAGSPVVDGAVTGDTPGETGALLPPDIEDRSRPAQPGTASAPSPGVPPTPPTPLEQEHLIVSAADVGTGVNRRELIGSGDRFVAGRRLFFWTRSLHGRPGDRIHHIWLYEGRTVATYELKIDGPHWRNFSRHDVGAAVAGAWAVEARDTDGRLLARRTFVCVIPEQV